MNESKVAEGSEEEKVFVGIDVHKKRYAVTVICEGRPVKRWSMPADNQSLCRKLKEDYSGKRILTVYEAGFSGFVLHRALEAAGIENIVVHPAHVAANPGERVKTDKRDSFKLGFLLSKDLLRGIRIPTKEEEERRQLSRYRQQLVKERTRVMVQIRRRLYHFGYDVSGGILKRSAVKELLLHLPEGELKSCVISQCRHWDFLEKELKEINSEIALQAKSCPCEELYRSVPGIGRVTARILATELGDFSQFQSEKALFSFVGLTPTEHSSGEHVRRGRISQQGNATLRKVLVEAAWVAIKRDKGLRLVYSRISARAGAKRAIVAVARKLIGRVRAVVRSGKPYEIKTEEALAA